MTTQEFITAIEATYAQGVAIIRAKNADYATEVNPFRNFEYAAYCNVPVEKAILVRISDKFARLCRLIDKGDANRVVLDETTVDTLIDMINYLAILKVYLEAHNEVR